MAFNTLAFIFAFLPIAVVLYLVCPPRLKNVFLVVLSLVFYAWGNPTYIVLMVFSILFNYFAGLQISACSPAKAEMAETTVGSPRSLHASASRPAAAHAPVDSAYGEHSRYNVAPDLRASAGTSAARFWLVCAVAVNLLVLGFFKYYGFLVDNVNAVFHLEIAYTPLALPVGLSFFTFSVITYLADVYTHKGEAQRNLIDFALYVSFFPKVMSGPIVAYHDMAAQLRKRTLSLAKLGCGARLFIVGLAKKVLVADCLNTTFTAISALPAGEMSTLSAWLGCICYTLVIYFDFSGYSDMAIGIAKMFGFDIDKNFDYPYISKSATEFWRRWHISLGSFFRNYVYIPLGGNRVPALRHILNICIVWLLTGLWHGAAWNFVFWGAFYGVLLLIEKYALKNVMDRIPAVIRHIVTMLLVMVGWVFFFSPSLGSAFVWLGQMVGVGEGGLVDAAGRYYLGQSILLIVAGAVGSTPLLATLATRFAASSSKAKIPVVAIGGAVALMLCTAFMVGSTYSSFLYFKF